jgi:hypothetical protein
MKEQMQNKRSIAREWFCLLTGPLAWLSQFIINYSLVRWECIDHSKTALHMVSASFLLMVVGAGILSAKVLIDTRQHTSSGEEMAARPHFMAMLGVFSSALFTLAIIMQVVATFVWSPCLR